VGDILFGEKSFLIAGGDDEGDKRGRYN